MGYRSIMYFIWYLMGAESPLAKTDEHWGSYVIIYGCGQGPLRWGNGYGDQYSYTYASSRIEFAGHGDISNMYGSGVGDGSN